MGEPLLRSPHVPYSLGLNNNGQIYSFTRFAALVLVSLNLVFFTTRTPINCQAGGVVRVRHRSPQSDWSLSQIWIKLQVVSAL
jgi:hypothetical protein